ncbi:VanZ family protein [Streptomyces sp. NPDC050448]|uniref:VanZ family protein n=1 Tax=Streptomyces sp. NPDC050448 TaxID=3155404 RepID=UPI00341F4461
MDQLFVIGAPAVWWTFGATTVVLVTAALLTAGRTGMPKPASALFGCALSLQLAATLAPVGRGSGGGTCAVDHYGLGRALDPQWGLNACMTVPVSFLAVMLFRRKRLVLAGVLLLGLTTELVQALVGEIGRSCDSGDFVANAVGSVAGVLLGALWHRRSGGSGLSAEPPQPRAEKAARVTALTMAALAGVVLLVFTTAVRTTTTTNTSPPEVPEEQRAGAVRVARSLWGPDTRIARVQAAADPDPKAERVLVVTSDVGFTEVAWPSLKPVRGTRSLETHRTAADAELPADAQVHSAQTYVKAHFAWADGATVTSSPLGDTGRRLVSWRRTDRGVLMPMRLDVVVDGSGLVASFVALDEPNPSLPPVQVDDVQARAIAAEAAPGQHLGTPVLLAMSIADRWRPVWLFPADTSPEPGDHVASVGPSRPGGTAPRIMVDAENAELIAPQAVRAGAEVTPEASASYGPAR